MLKAGVILLGLVSVFIRIQNGLGINVCPENGCNCIWVHPHPPKLHCCCRGKNVTRVPSTFTNQVQVVHLRGTGISSIEWEDFKNYTKIETLEISDIPHLSQVDGKSFSELQKLEKLTIRGCPNLKRIDGVLIIGKSLLSLDLSSNKIEEINTHAFADLQLSSLILVRNRLKIIHNDAFNNSEIEVLKLSGNYELEIIDKHAFRGMERLKELDISSTSVKRLPEDGLKHLYVLRAEKVFTLKRLPSIFTFTRLKKALLTYPYHCCLFKHVNIEPVISESVSTNLQEMREKYCKLNQSTDTPPSMTSPTEIRHHKRKKRVTYIEYAEAVEDDEDVVEGGSLDDKTDESDYYWGLSSIDGGTWGRFEELEPDEEVVEAKEVTIGPIFWNRPITIEGPRVFICDDESSDTLIIEYYQNIKCTPQPDALNPCEDVMSHFSLRIIIWLVWLAALTANSVVLFALFVTRKLGPQKALSVHSLLMMNVAAADFTMGVYLAMLAIQDVRTAGQYYNYAVDWQTGLGCKFAGFITVFASELSIFAMLIISFEVWYNTRYIFYGKRLKIGVVMGIMVIGWLLALCIAAMPLIGVSSYSATSTCLPLEFVKTADRVYLVFILILNLIIFSLICTSYIHIYCMVSAPSRNSSCSQDIVIAKRMAVLIVTDFLCWAPTIFFGLTAAVNVPLINISIAKIFLVIFYPLNSCSNPFLYAFLSKQFRKDLHVAFKNFHWYQRWILKENRPSISTRTTQLSLSMRPSVVSRENSTRSTTPILAGSSEQEEEDDGRKDSLDLRSMSGVGLLNSVNAAKRRLSERRIKFQPAMSDIVESSNTNSVNDETGSDTITHVIHEESPLKIAPPPVAVTVAGSHSISDFKVDSLESTKPRGSTVSERSWGGSSCRSYAGTLEGSGSVDRNLLTATSRSEKSLPDSGYGTVGHPSPEAKSHIIFVFGKEPEETCKAHEALRLTCFTDQMGDIMETSL